MSTTKKVEQLIAQMENHLECWKQFNQFVGLARGKKFGQEDESQFLEIKSVLVQELESQWHKIYIGWHAVLGQLKARQTNEENKSGLGAMFSKKEK